MSITTLGNNPISGYGAVQQPFEALEEDDTDLSGKEDDSPEIKEINALSADLQRQIQELREGYSLTKSEEFSASSQALLESASHLDSSEAKLKALAIFGGANPHVCTKFVVNFLNQQLSLEEDIPQDQLDLLKPLVVRLEKGMELTRLHGIRGHDSLFAAPYTELLTTLSVGEGFVFYGGYHKTETSQGHGLLYEIVRTASTTYHVLMANTGEGTHDDGLFWDSGEGVVIQIAKDICLRNMMGFHLIAIFSNSLNHYKTTAQIEQQLKTALELEKEFDQCATGELQRFGTCAMKPLWTWLNYHWGSHFPKTFFCLQERFGKLCNEKVDKYQMHSPIANKRNVELLTNKNRTIDYSLGCDLI